MHRVPLNPEAFALFFAVVWLGVSGMISIMAGWSSLARRFRSSAGPTVRGKLTSAEMGLSTYNSCVYVGFSDAGIHLRLVFLFRFLHPPLVIPWSEITSRTRARRFFGEWEQFTIADGPKFSFRGRIPDQYLPLLPAAT